MNKKQLLITNQPKVGDLIRELRLINKLAQQEMAISLGVNYSTSTVGKPDSQNFHRWQYKNNGNA